jgi:CRP-like cAMP-binding protein
MAVDPTSNGAGRPEIRVDNNLLQFLRPDDLVLLLPFLKAWAGPAGKVLYEPGDEVRHVYFPCGSSLVSYRVALDDRPDIETLLVGREGAVGGVVSHGRAPAFARAVVQFPGRFLRMESAELEELKLSSVTLRYLFDRYADCLLAQVFQSVACNAAHTIEQRAAKWMLAAIDRIGGTGLTVTQEQLAGMLGVGRSYVNRVIRTLRARGVLDTHRGSIRVRDAEVLKGLACGCNDEVRRHFDDVLAGIYPRPRRAQ